MNIEDIKNFIKNRVFRHAGSCSSQGSMEFNILNELYFDLFGEPAVNTIPQYNIPTMKVDHIENTHDYVDLGLPSGTLWVTCNVGANKPWEFGNYYAWGETKPKECYDWDTYLDGNILIHFLDCGTDKDLLKNVANIADTQYDAAKANTDGKWRMPTKDQQNELRNECYWVWTENYNNSNVSGCIVYKAKAIDDKGKYVNGEILSTSYKPSDAHIFLPAAGYHHCENLYGAGDFGSYWSSSLEDSNSLSCAWSIVFDSYSTYNTSNCRYYGYSIRPVLNQKS